MRRSPLTGDMQGQAETVLEEQVLRRVRPGICAVGYLTVRAEDYVHDPSRPFFKVVGSGFLVRDTTAITNRHVIEALLEAQRDTGFSDDQRFLSFVYPRSGGWQTAHCKMQSLAVVSDRDLDIGFIEFRRRQEPEFKQCRPLALGDLSRIIVGQSVAVCGYPYGTRLLTRDQSLYRFGPVLQQGFISAVAPYDNVSRPNELLLDVRIAGGMSGAPVFRPDDGTTIGIVHASWENTVALAIPCDAATLGSWLSLRA